MNRLGVLGWPVAHSLSPAMQNAALQAAGVGEKWRYQLLPVPPELFDETTRALPAVGFRGVNVTIPHKAAALALATDASATATATGAANTLLFNREGEIRADNTDAPALIAALRRRIEPAGATALVLGAGGSARAAVWALRDAGARDVRVWNRTPERAAALAAEFGSRAVADPATAADADILVNCTSVGLREGDRLEAVALSGEQLRHHRVVVDFVYREGGTALTHTAAAQGVSVIDGLELLVGQGALAFGLFTGLEAPVQAMRDAVGLSSAR
ncbi:MAG: shikimate dehydrogenase [Conexibacteraceae bacterium]|nr:shikimate dehydrogenase [Conexibacteraceae bacterium]